MPDNENGNGLEPGTESGTGTGTETGTEEPETEPTEPAEQTGDDPEPEPTPEPTDPTALELMKARLNRLPSDTVLDVYFQARIDAARGYLEGIGIHLTDSVEDLLLLVDLAVWQYQNRDKPGGMPDWLRLQRRERWLREKPTETTEADTDSDGTSDCGCDCCDIDDLPEGSDDAGGNAGGGDGQNNTGGDGTGGDGDGQNGTGGDGTGGGGGG